MDKEKIGAEIDAVTVALVNQLSEFSDEHFNTRPAWEGWSAGQIGEHLLMLARNVNRNLRARTYAPDRPADDKIGIIATVFDDYEQKYSAPEQIIPNDVPKNKAAIIAGLQEAHQHIKEVALSEDLSVICKGFNHPSLGAFTRLEWIYFIIHHAYRHIHQMSNILAAVK